MGNSVSLYLPRGKIFHVVIQRALTLTCAFTNNMVKKLGITVLVEV